MKTATKAARQAAAYQLDFLPNTRHPESTRYSVCVLWLLGLGSSSIAKVLLIPRTSVASIVARSEYSDRSSMTDRQRQTLLDELKSIRFEDGRPLDGGQLDKVRWEIMPLTGGKRRSRRAA